MPLFYNSKDFPKIGPGSGFPPFGQALVVLGLHELDEVDDPVGVAHLVVVPVQKHVTN
jgi:hypothetical protein